MMELNRIASHLVWLATTGMELGALSMMIYGFREREFILSRPFPGGPLGLTFRGCRPSYPKIPKPPHRFQGASV